jgi:hypothetical protein
MLWAAALVVPAAWGQEIGRQEAQPAERCPLQAEYPLPADLPSLRALADSQQVSAGEPGCLKSATFHAWRGATLLALGRYDEAVEPLERALLQDPDLPGAQLDLAQALAAQGDSASAVAFLTSLRQRADLPRTIGTAIDRQLGGLLLPDLLRKGAALASDWQSRWQFSTLAGVDSNLNNAPASSEITLTFPQGNITLPLDPSSQPRRGKAFLGVAQWQGLRPQGESLWVLQAELRARQTAELDTSYQQADLAASWLQAPAAPTQWVGRVATGYLRYAGAGLLQATRTSIQYQWDALGATAAAWWPDRFAGCRPAASLELEHRRYPSSRALDGVYQGGAFGLLCRGSGQQLTRERNAGSASSQSFYSIQARMGDERPIHDERPGGSYRRAELKAQWEGPLFASGRFGVQWTSTRQIDRQPFSILLGNLPRHTSRHLLQLEASWPVAAGLSVVGSAEAALQRSNLAAFESRQRSLYVGLRWELMQ